MKTFIAYWHLLDEMVNVLLGGKFNRTISARLGYWYYEKKGWRKVVAYLPLHFLNIFESDHCYKAMVADKESRVRHLV